MMQIVYFSRKAQFITQLETQVGEVTFVTPSPLKADGLRSRLTGSKGQDVITIAKFTSELVQVLWEDEGKPDVKRKADLLLIFGILKNKYFPDLGYEQFTQAYNLFSDLRSFTLNEEALSPVMDEQPEEIQKAVQLFWRLLDATGYLDEHAAYQKITEALRSSEEKEELNKTYVFWGFQHLNGQQVDLLKALAIRYRVIIPFPLALKEKLKKGDWLSWIKDASVEELDLPVHVNAPKASWLAVNSRENALRLKDIIQDGDQVILGVSKLAALHMDFLPSSKVNYKIPHQLIDAEVKEVGQELKEKFGKGGDLVELGKSLKGMIVFGEFKRLKAVQLYQEALKAITELTDEVVTVDRFFLKLLNEVVSLNQPRSSYVPMSPTDLTIELKDMSTLEDVNRDRRVILCIDERFEDIQGLGQNYTEVIQKSLGALGPLKRNELELHFKHWEFVDLFTDAKVLVLMSQATLKHSLIWKRLFAGIELLPVEEDFKSPARVVTDHFQKIDKKIFDGSFSASKFQTFLDCPRKFYFSYVDKIVPSVALEKDFDPMVSGTIIHKIIEVFHKRELSEDMLPALTTEIMGEFIAERKLKLPRETYLQRQLIFNQRALNGIQFLKKLEESVGEKVKWNIEEEFNLVEDYKLNGKIDCVGVSDHHMFLLDFKSTKFAASSNKEVEELESIQLWAYAKAASVKYDNFATKSVVLGYVVLDNPSESNLLLSDTDLMVRLKDARICRQKVFKEDFAALFKSANEKMVSLALAIRAEKNYAAIPRKANACHFCELTKVCVKSELKHV
ncbi:MAG TPA: PD-(D/E)XK nuclease family protein [Bacteriovoracaceae bacterium]|nr:PD-(D/E)XK nuclease family protein [Bacteriovoracaceae bacterium]